MLAFMNEEDDQGNVSQDGNSSDAVSSDDVSTADDKSAGQAVEDTTEQTSGQVSGQIGIESTAQSADKSTAQSSARSTDKGSSQSFSLQEALSDDSGKLGSHKEDFLVPSTTGKKAKYSTMILGGVFLIGAATLFFMISKFGPNEASAGLSEEEIKIESAIAKLSGSKAAINSKMNDIVDRISSLSRVEQVSVDELRRNPFIFDDSGVDVSALVDEDYRGTGLKLWSVMESDGSRSCMINDRIYRPGDVVGNYTIKSIGEGIVELTAGKKVLVLRMSK